MKYQTIIIDPPWCANDQLKMSKVKRGASSQYSVLTTNDLKSLKINELADPAGCVMGMWCLGSMLQDAMDLMKTYGFKQKQTYCWVKIKKNAKEINNCLMFGMGRLCRQSHELCLIGVNNTGIYKSLKNKSQRSVSFGENVGHSTKPEHLQDSFDLMFPSANKVELFARRVRPGWDCVGNVVSNGEDIRVSIDKLIRK